VVAAGTRTNPVAGLRQALARRKKAELVDVLVEADRGGLAVETSEAFPPFPEECWKDFRDSSRISTRNEVTVSRFGLER